MAAAHALWCVEIWFEALPSPSWATRERVQADIDRLPTDLARIVVPEVLDGDHATIDNIHFARAVQQATRLPVTGAIITAARDEAALAHRIALADAAGVRPLFVGPSRRDQAGVGVESALRRHGAGRDAGVVTIPQRRRWRLDEPQRLLRKQRAGASYAISQILFDASDALAVRRAYLASLAPGEAPIPVVYSLAPVCRPRDAAFLERLGVAVPTDVAAAGSRREEVARRAAVGAALELATVHADEALGPIGFCISHVMVGNVAAAATLAEAIRDAVRAARQEPLCAV